MFDTWDAWLAIRFVVKVDAMTYARKTNPKNSITMLAVVNKDGNFVHDNREIAADTNKPVLFHLDNSFTGETRPQMHTCHLRPC